MDFGEQTAAIKIEVKSSVALHFQRLKSLAKRINYIKMCYRIQILRPQGNARKQKEEI